MITTCSVPERGHLRISLLLHVRGVIKILSPLGEDEGKQRPEAEEEEEKWDCHRWVSTSKSRTNNSRATSSSSSTLFARVIINYGSSYDGGVTDVVVT